MSKEFTANYKFVCKELEILSSDLYEIATQIDKQTTLEEVGICYNHLQSILRQLILARVFTRLPSKAVYVFDH